MNMSRAGPCCFVFVVWASLTIIFILFKLLPDDPTAIFVDNNFSVEMINRQKALWGLNDPVWLQYVRYLKNMALFDFGESAASESTKSPRYCPNAPLTRRY